jgi:hypothetical protein
MSQPLPKVVREYLKTITRKGGKARAAKLSPKRRQEIARHAAQTRWAKRRRKPSGR